jgi:hypothetical protein
MGENWIAAFHRSIEALSKQQEAVRSVRKVISEARIPRADLERSFAIVRSALIEEAVEKTPSSVEEICGFCGKRQSEVSRLVVAAAATICNECVEIAREAIVWADREEAPRIPFSRLLRRSNRKHD